MHCDECYIVYTRLYSNRKVPLTARELLQMYQNFTIHEIHAQECKAILVFVLFNTYNIHKYSLRLSSV
jgi:hypothetical protein